MRLSDGAGLCLEVLPAGGGCWRPKQRYAGTEKNASSVSTRACPRRQRQRQPAAQGGEIAVRDAVLRPALTRGHDPYRAAGTPGGASAPHQHACHGRQRHHADEQSQ